MRRQVASALGLIVALVSVGAAPVGAAATAQPGMAIEVEGVGCTLAFLLIDPSTSQRYATTAGHCVPGMDSRATHDRTWEPRRGPVVADLAGRRLGRIVFSALAEDADFALLRLDDPVVAVPRVCGWSAPTTMDSSGVEQGDEARFHGQGAAVGTAAPSRSGVVSGASSDYSISLLMLAAPGDSGGPVLVGDTAAAILVAAGGSQEPDVGLIQAMRLDVMLERSQAATPLDLQLLDETGDEPTDDIC